jgi:hypothetical protein
MFDSVQILAPDFVILLSDLSARNIGIYCYSASCIGHINASGGIVIEAVDP